MSKFLDEKRRAVKDYSEPHRVRMPQHLCPDRPVWKGVRGTCAGFAVGTLPLSSLYLGVRNPSDTFPYRVT